MVTRKESGETFLGFGSDGSKHFNDVFRLKIGDNNVATWSRMHINIAIAKVHLRENSYLPY